MRRSPPARPGCGQPRTDWNAAGPVQFGRRLFQGTYGEYADGRLSDVRLYATALPPADATAIGGSPALTQLG
ncbi:hypothetical protein [Streptomyces griseus]|uniref:hypothetical protein n=1 Tax=Streptomyces griseus TaxID=1911 RepID=UPI0005694AAE|nr:hypothetical protein [Streptomyces griseus]